LFGFEKIEKELFERRKVVSGFVEEEEEDLCLLPNTYIGAFLVSFQIKCSSLSFDSFSDLVFVIVRKKSLSWECQFLPTVFLPSFDQNFITV
jgi:hypothetical protein